MFANDIWLMLILFIFGGLMLVLELMMPGFGIPGIAGIISLIAGLVVGSTLLTASQLAIVFLLVFVYIAVMVVLLYRSATKNGRISKLFLRAKAVKEEGYSSSENFEDMVGKEGVAITPLRPSGMGEFEDTRLDVVTEGQFIPKGVKIKIVKVEGFRIVVEQVYDDDNRD